MLIKQKNKAFLEANNRTDMVIGKNVFSKKAKLNIL